MEQAFELEVAHNFRQFTAKQLSTVLQAVWALEPRFAVAIAKLIFVCPSEDLVVDICKQLCTVSDRGQFVVVTFARGISHGKNQNCQY